MSGPRRPDFDNDDVVEGTRIESVEESREAARPARTPTLQEAVAADDTTPFRPTARPPMATLCIVDDGREDGDVLRLRGDRLVIGRSEGDLLIPHDTMMSARHAELARHFSKGRYRWYLIDLQSTNGTYVRAGSAPLDDGKEFLIG